MSAPTTHRAVAFLVVALLPLTATGVGVSPPDRTGDSDPAAADTAASTLMVTPDREAGIELALHEPGLGGWPADADTPRDIEEPRDPEDEPSAERGSSPPDCAAHFGPGPC